jgi:hypothetical protein
MRGALILAALLTGCGCDEPSLVPVPAEPATLEPATAAPAPAAPLAAPVLPRVTRTDLPPALPSVTIEVTAGGYRVTNRALVETWPASERAEAAAHAPPGEPDFPVVELDVPVADPAPLRVPRVPALGDALGRLAAADRARTAAAGGGPRVFAVRASTDVRWERIVAALYTASQSGYAEPWLVVHSGEGERVLQLTFGGAPLSANVREAVAAALAALEGLGPDLALPAEPAAVLDEVEAAQANLFVRLEEDGLWLRRPELGALGADCRTADGRGAPTLPRSGDVAALRTCLDAAAPFALAIVEASPDLAYGAVVPVIEALVGRAPVAIGIGSGALPETPR